VQERRRLVTEYGVTIHPLQHRFGFHDVDPLGELPRRFTVDLQIGSDVHVAAQPLPLLSPDPEPDLADAVTGRQRVGQLEPATPLGRHPAQLLVHTREDAADPSASAALNSQLWTTFEQ
jgi:hypothetical protein